MTRILTIAHIIWLNVLRRKDVYVVFTLLLVIITALISLNIFGLGSATGYIKEIGLLAVWLFAWILAVNISSRMLPEEESQETVFSLLATPATRLQVVIGKWLGCWTVVCAATMIFYAILTVMVLARGSGFQMTALAQALSLHLCMLAMLCALGVALSTRLNSDAAAALAYTISLSSFLLLPRTPDLAMTAKGFHQTGLMLIYYVLPHFELFDMRIRLVHAWGAAPPLTFLAVLAYGFLITVALLTLGWLGYRTKRFARGAT